MKDPERFMPSKCDQRLFHLFSLCDARAESIVEPERYIYLVSVLCVLSFSLDMRNCPFATLWCNLPRYAYARGGCTGS